jgi:hypothetical protein
MIAHCLKNAIETYATELRGCSLLRLAREGRVPPRTVSMYLTSILHLIRHTPIHLERARSRAEVLGNDHLASYFAKKGREEIGHDRWAENDIEAVNTAFGLKPTRAPLRPVVELTRYLSAAINDDPARYLAYIFFAEYVTVLLGPDWLSALEDSCGVPASSMTVVAHHVELDQAHFAQGLNEIDQLISDPAQLQPLRQTLLESMDHFSRFCDELAASAA